MSENTGLSLFSGNGLEVKNIKILKFENGELVDRTPALLLDCSGSMKSTDCAGGERRIDVLNRISQKITGLPTFSFNSQVQRVRFTGFLSAEGGTDLINAISFVSSTKYIKYILVSDGCPDDRAYAMEKALSLRVPWDCIYIGTEEDGRKFMQELVERSGGTFTTADTMNIEFQQIVEAGITKALLEAGK